MRCLALLFLVAACRAPSVVSLGSEEIGVEPALDFGSTVLNFPRKQSLTLTNRSKVSRSVSLTVAVPFSVAPATVELPAGTGIDVEVIFRPSQVGLAEGVLELDGEARVALRGTGIEPTRCPPADGCITFQFDPDSFSCRETRAQDGTACRDERGCIEGGTCSAGKCVGEAARCDDKNACTVDACAIGNGCQHLALECPSSPCQAGTCHPKRGCELTPVLDGTACGPLSCEMANLCVAGSCRSVVPPDGFVCSVESACRGAGVCRGKICVTPPERPLLPRWTYNSPVHDFRFEGVSDDSGNWYWVECALQRQQLQCEAVSTTPSGLERIRTRTPQMIGNSFLVRNEFDGNQLVANGLFIFVKARGGMAAVSTNTGALVWDLKLADEVERLVADGLGGLWVITRMAGETATWSLVRLEAATGRSVVSAMLRELKPISLLTAPDGPAFVVSEFLNVGRVERVLQRFERSGTQTFSVPVLVVPLQGFSMPTLAMVNGDRVVMTDDSAYSVMDGRQLEQAPREPAPNGYWRTSGGAVGLGSGLSRVRLASAQLPAFGILESPLAVQVRTQAGQTRVYETSGLRFSDPWLTRDSNVLFATFHHSVEEVRLREVQLAGTELMSCSLGETGSTDYARLGFNGSQLAMSVGGAREDTIGERLLVYDLGPKPPGHATAGWVGPRGMPGNTGRSH